MQLLVNLRGLLLGCLVLNDCGCQQIYGPEIEGLGLSEKSKAADFKSLQQGSCNILTRSQNACHNQSISIQYTWHLGTPLPLY